MRAHSRTHVRARAHTHAHILSSLLELTKLIQILLKGEGFDVNL